MISVELDDLVDMMVHPCRYCSYLEPGQCSEQGGCSNGVRAYLKDKFKDEIRDSES